MDATVLCAQFSFVSRQAPILPLILFPKPQDFIWLRGYTKGRFP